MEAIFGRNLTYSALKTHPRKPNFLENEEQIFSFSNFSQTAFLTAKICIT